MFGILSTIMICSCDIRRQESCGFIQNGYGERVSWKGNTPIIFHIHSSMPTEYRDSIHQAAIKWEKAIGHTLFQFINDDDDKSPLLPRQDGVNTIYYMTKWEEESPSEQARTSVYWVGDEIKETDIRINAKNFSFFIDKPTSYTDIHLESLMIHELGHVLGLMHQNKSSNQIMYPYLSESSIRNVISKSDIANAQCEYK